MLSLLAAALVLVPQAKHDDRPNDPTLATAVWVQFMIGERTGEAMARIGDRGISVGSGALRVWLLDDGKFVGYSTPEGAGGYENEGEALFLYDIRAKHCQEALREVFPIQEVVTARSRAGRLFFVVRMRDGGLGAPHLGIVYQRRGYVWRAPFTELVLIEGGRAMIAQYKPRETDHSEGWGPKTTRWINLDDLVARPIVDLVKR